MLLIVVDVDTAALILVLSAALDTKSYCPAVGLSFLISDSAN